MEQLKQGQRIFFTIKDKEYKYQIQHCYLRNLEDEENSKIFSVLGLDKKKFASDAYGYKAYDGNWPMSNNNDYAALTRLIEALFPYCDEVIVDDKVVYSKSEKIIFKEPESSISSKSESSDIIDFESIVQISKIKLIFI